MRFRWLSVWLVAALVGCASEVDLRTASVSHMTSTEIVEADPSDLLLVDYLSTSQPNRAVLKAVAAAGYVAVVDLRGSTENRGIDERAEVERLGMRYHSLPVPTPADATPATAARLKEILGWSKGPVLLHCATGNRVGALFALNAKASGASNEEALTLGRQAGLTRWETQIGERLAAMPVELQE